MSEYIAPGVTSAFRFREEKYLCAISVDGRITDETSDLSGRANGWALGVSDFINLHKTQRYTLSVPDQRTKGKGLFLNKSFLKLTKEQSGFKPRSYESTFVKVEI